MNDLLLGALVFFIGSLYGGLIGYQMGQGDAGLDTQAADPTPTAPMERPVPTLSGPAAKGFQPKAIFIRKDVRH